MAPAGPGWRFSFRRLGTIDLITGGATLVLFISLFLPWFGAYGFHRSGIGAHGYLFLVVLTSIALLAYLVYRAGWDDMPIRLPIAHAPLLLVVGVFNLLFVLLAFLTGFHSIGRSYGSWLALLAALGAALPIGIAAIRSMQGGSPAGYGGPAYGAVPPGGGVAPGGVAPGGGSAPGVGIAPQAGGPMTPQPPGAGYPAYGGAPSPTMGFGEAVRTVLSKYADFSGRARRAEYWWSMLAYWLGFMVIAFILFAVPTLGMLLGIVYMLGGFIPLLAVTVRRLHDTDRSGAWFLISLAPFGGIVLLVFTVTEGTPGPNQYGPPPKPMTSYLTAGPAYQMAPGQPPGYPPAGYGQAPGYPPAGYGQQPPGYPPAGYGPPQ